MSSRSENATLHIGPPRVCAIQQGTQASNQRRVTWRRRPRSDPAPDASVSRPTGPGGPECGATRETCGHATQGTYSTCQTTRTTPEPSRR
eukprot:9490477-Pyramimonas_sp.AAC.1